MKQIIRSKTFETNSSSMHSIAISKQKDSYYTPEEVLSSFYLHTENNKIHFKSEDLSFDRWPFCILSSYFNKLCYVIASIGDVWDEFKREEFFKFIHNVHPTLGEFIFDLDSYNNYDYGYVDHQSKNLFSQFIGNFKNNNELFTKIEDFLSNKRYKIIIDGDEYEITSDYKDMNLLNCDLYWGEY